ncbi:MAG TPA: 5'-nucleotidase, lipoprotein e(P4) family [Spirochaetia bacterium]|nr:5'-nucleotidase, lipoprotein e(P4) family [Spirochaetia bacterium]
MGRLSPRIAAVLLFCAFLALGSATGFAQDKASVTVKDLNEQTVMALSWMEASAEYRELCYQAYNLADMIVDKALAAPSDKPLAIIADLDETLIDNSAYDAGLVGTSSSYAGKTWTMWENAAMARGMPGASDFLNDVKGKHVEVFYVTNRDQAGLAGTIKNLQALGFPFADAKHVLVSTGSSDKQPRFDQVAKDYNVAVYMGDNANDLPIGTYHKSMADRNSLVDQNKAMFGTKFVALPNPTYGDWEGALAPGYFGLTPEKKDQARKSVLQTWTAP